MRLGDIVIPHSQILFVSESAFLVASVQHPVCRIFKILQKILYRMEISVYTVVIAMTSQCRRYYLHCFRQRLCQSGLQPRFCRLLLCLQLFAARSHSQPISPRSGSGIVKRERKKIKIFFRSSESACRQYPCFLLRDLQREFTEPWLQSLHYLLRLVFVLEQYQEIVRISYVIRLASESGFYPFSNHRSST